MKIARWPLRTFWMFRRRTAASQSKEFFLWRKEVTRTPSTKQEWFPLSSDRKDSKDFPLVLEAYPLIVEAYPPVLEAFPLVLEAYSPVFEAYLLVLEAYPLVLEGFCCECFNLMQHWDSPTRAVEGGHSLTPKIPKTYFVKIFLVEINVISFLR